MTTFFRLRAWGADDWTEVAVEGKLEEFIAENLRCALEDYDMHIQERVEEEWEDL